MSLSSCILSEFTTLVNYFCPADHHRYYIRRVSARNVDLKLQQFVGMGSYEKLLVKCFNRLIFFLIEPTETPRPIGNRPSVFCPMTLQKLNGGGQSKIYHQSIKRIVSAEL